MRRFGFGLVLWAGLAAGQNTAIPGGASTAGPLFTTADAALGHPVKVIAYGDTRFTDPREKTASNPNARRALVVRIAEERPDALLVSGDLPWRGNMVEDYAVFREETEPWRAAGLRLYPALGNHEFAHCEPAVCLENWWNALPEIPQLRGHRWYSAQLGSSLYMMSLDSDTSLLPGSEQRKWVEQQIAGIPASTRFVLINLHHPPVADVQTRMHVDHNPRENEISLGEYLEKIAQGSRARFVVIAGHIHNYERFEQGGVSYFVSGGGGAEPYEVERTAKDLYQDRGFPNFHYLRFLFDGHDLKGEMVRLENPDGGTPVWKTRDSFVIRGK